MEKPVKIISKTESKITLAFDLSNENALGLFFDLKDLFESEVNRVKGELTIDEIHSSSIFERIKQSNVEVDGIELLKESFENISNLKKQILSDRDSTYEQLLSQEEFKIFCEELFSKLNISSDGKFGEITRKQLVKIYSMRNLDNMINFSEPGAGKTLMSLMRLNSIMEPGEKVIIVSPKNSMNVWADEVKKFSKDEKLVHFMNGDMHKHFSDRKFRKIDDFGYADYILINYESLQNILTEDNISKLLQSKYHVIFDEAHRIKNSISVRNERSKKLGNSAKSRILLTGTPYSRSIEDIKEMIQITWGKENPFISNDEFNDYIASINPGDISKGDNISEYTKNKLDDFNDKINPLFFVLRKVEDFGIEPEDDLYNNPIIVEPTKEQIEADENYMYAMTSLGRELLQAKTTFQKNEILEQLNAVITQAQMNSTGENKIEAAIDFIKQTVSSGKKILVWAQFIKNITLLKSKLDSLDIKTEVLYGETPVDERRRIINDITSPLSNIEVLIANPDTLAESVSLHKYIYTSLFLERRLVYYRWAQAKDRIHRVGSTKKVTHNYIKTKNLGIENYTFTNLETKNNVAKSILNYSNIIEGMVINYQNMKSEKEEIEEMVKSLARKKDVVE